MNSRRTARHAEPAELAEKSASARSARSARSRFFSVLPWSALVAASAAHFAYSAGRAAWTTLGGDFLSAFPGPLALRVGQLWPSLGRDWIAGALGMGPDKWNYGPV